MSIARRHFLAAAAGAALVAGARAQPAGPLAGRQLRFIVGYAAGGVADVTARICLDGIAAALGAASVTIENRPGANGNIGTEFVARHPPDGATFLVAPSSQFTTNPNVAELRIKTLDVMRALVPVAPLADTPMVLVVPPASAITGYAQFIDKARAGGLRVGNPGTGTPMHLVALLIERRAGVSLIHVPYKGGAPMMSDLSGAHIDAAVASVSSATALVAGGKARWISSVQTPLPGVPSIASELGAAVPAWTGVFAPAGTAADVMDALNAAVAANVRNPSVAGRLKDQGLEPMTFSRAEMQQRLAREAEFMAGFLGTVKLQF